VSALPFRNTLEGEVVLLERNGLVGKEPRSYFESIWDGVRGNIQVEGTRDIGEWEGNIVGRVFGVRRWAERRVQGRLTGGNHQVD